MTCPIACREQRRAYRAGGGPAHLVVRPREVVDWGTSMTCEFVKTLMNAPGIARTLEGRPLADAEAVHDPSAAAVHATVQISQTGF